MHGLIIFDIVAHISNSVVPTSAPNMRSSNTE